MLVETLRSGPIPSLTKDLGEKWAQLWMKMNAVTLHKIVEMAPLRMRAVIKANCGPWNVSVWLFFWLGSVIVMWPLVTLELNDPTTKLHNMCCFSPALITRVADFSFLKGILLLSLYTTMEWSSAAVSLCWKIWECLKYMDSCINFVRLSLLSSTHGCIDVYDTFLWRLSGFDIHVWDSSATSQMCIFRDGKFLPVWTL